MVARELQRNVGLGITAVGFLDDEPAKLGKWIHGVRVLGPLSSLDSVLTTHRVDEVLIAMPSAPGKVVRAIAEACRVTGVRSRTVPGVFELLDGQVNFSRVRQIEIVDQRFRGLLDRKILPG